MDNMLTAHYGTQIAAGATWLDLHGPADWRSRVRAKPLIMSHPGKCVLGHVFGSYWDVRYGMIKWGNVPQLSHDEAVNLGFQVEDDTDDNEDYESLGRAWTQFLAEPVPA